MEMAYAALTYIGVGVFGAVVGFIIGLIYVGDDCDCDDDITDDELWTDE